MKTGGTLNFLKRAGAIFMLIAVFASSCNKYADDFKQLNTKLDALATQVAGVTQLTTDMTALKSQVTALQTSVAGLPNVASITALQTALTAISGKVDALTTTLNAVAASGTATKAVVDGLKTDLAALATKVAADNAAAIAKLVAMDGKLDANQTAALKAINDQAAALSAKIAAETVAITGKVDAAAAASAAAAAANLAQMATNQAALVASLNGISAAQAANLAALTAEITALKTNMTEQLTAMTAANTANLNTLLASNAALASAMTAQFDAMTAADLANLATLEGKLSATQAALATLINDIQATNAGSFASLLAAQAAESALAATRALETANSLAQLIASQNAQIAAADANNAASVAAIAGLRALLDAQRATLDQIMANTALYVGDVLIQSDEDVTFFMTKLTQLAAVNGNLTIKTANINDLAGLNTITSNIKSVIGVGSVNLVPSDAKPIVLAQLGSVAGDFTAKAPGAKMTSINISSLKTVYGNVELDFDGPYASTALTKVSKNLKLVDYAAVAPLVGTTAVDFPAVTVDGTLNLGGAVTFGIATKVVVGGSLTSLSAPKATSVKLTNENYSAGLSISAVLATSVDLSNLVNINYNRLTEVTTAGGLLSVTSAAGSTVNLDKFVGKNKAAAVQEDITLTGPTTATIPLWVKGLFTSTTVKNLTLGMNELNLGIFTPSITVAGCVLENLTANNLKGQLYLEDYPTLKTATVNGANAALGTGAGVSATALNTNLTSLVVSGSLYSVFVKNTPKLTTLTTSGTINDVVVDGAAKLAGVTFGHSHLSISIGSNLRIDNNPELLSLTTSTDKPQVLQVKNNAKLATANFSSYTNFLFNTTMKIHISGNKFGGTYSNAILSATDGYVQSKLTCDALATLKGLFATWDADQALGAAKTSTANWDININLLNVKHNTWVAGVLTAEDPAATSPLNVLNLRMATDAAHTVPAAYPVAPTGIVDYPTLRAILQ